jgi:hypothetical protein
MPDSPAKIVLLAFSGSSTNSGIVKASRIFDSLIGRRLWYVPRRSKDLVVGSIVVFYEAGSGVRGYATVSEVTDAEPIDQGSLVQFGLYHLPVKIVLSDIVIFESPVQLGVLVDRLDFVSNKKYWGHSLRATPRTISHKDFETILDFHAKSPSLKSFLKNS